MANVPDDWKGNPDGTPRIVEAVGALSSHGGFISDPDRQRQVETAMQQAVLDCLAEGIGMNQPDIIRARMMAARDMVLAKD